MKYSYALLAVISAALSIKSVAAGHVAYNFEVNKRSGDSDLPVPVPRLDFKKYRTINEPLTNQGFFYTVNISIGTPPQAFEVLLDTGSSDLWVMDVTNPYCLENGFDDETYPNQFNCSQVGGTFDSEFSETYLYSGADFRIQYADWTSAEGQYGTDVITLDNGDRVPDLQFGLAKVTNSSIGVLGIGLINNEASLNSDSPFSYSNFPAALKDVGLIDRNAYSLFISQAGAGEIVFGGVDRSKYVGGLWTLPITNPRAFTVNSTKITATNGVCTDPAVISDVTIDALLDSGTTLTFLPQHMVDDIGEAFDATFDDRVQGYVLDCDHKNRDDGRFLTFFFGELEVRVPLSQTLYSASEVAGFPVLNNEGQDLCFLGFNGIEFEDVAILGDAFLRSAYVVYDLDAMEISLGQSVTDAENVEEADIVDIADRVPGAQPASKYKPYTTTICATATLTSTASHGPTTEHTHTYTHTHTWATTETITTEVTETITHPSTVTLTTSAFQTLCPLTTITSLLTITSHETVHPIQTVTSTETVTSHETLCPVITVTASETVTTTNIPKTHTILSTTTITGEPVTVSPCESGAPVA